MSFLFSAKQALNLAHFFADSVLEDSRLLKQIEDSDDLFPESKLCVIPIVRNRITSNRETALTYLLEYASLKNAK